jgi:Protein of unknown function (DUF3311)
MMKSLKTALLTLMVAVVYLLHQDFWNWNKFEPLVFGFLPIGLAYQAAYSVLATATMAVLVKFAWPKHLENIVPPETSRPLGEPHA